MKTGMILGLTAAALSAAVTPATGYRLEAAVVTPLASIFVSRDVFLPGPPMPVDCLVDVGACDSTGFCTVNTGDCTGGGHCTINVGLNVPGVIEAAGNCSSGGACTVNLGTCADNSACTVNTDLGTCTNGAACAINDGNCDQASCTINGGDCSNGDGSLICLNTQCNNSNPGDDSENYAGQWCVMDLGGNEASGVLFNDPTKEFGELTAAVAIDVSDPRTNTIFDVRIVCTMQSTPNHGDGGVSRSVTQSGNTAALVDTISFNRVPGAPSYLCSEISWNSAAGHSVIYFDEDDNASNGIQCAEYIYSN